MPSFHKYIFEITHLTILLLNFILYGIRVVVFVYFVVNFCFFQYLLLVPIAEGFILYTYRCNVCYFIKSENLTFVWIVDMDVYPVDS